MNRRNMEGCQHLQIIILNKSDYIVVCFWCIKLRFGPV